MPDRRPRHASRETDMPHAETKIHRRRPGLTCSVGIQGLSKQFECVWSSRSNGDRNAHLLVYSEILKLKTT